MARAGVSSLGEAPSRREAASAGSARPGVLVTIVMGFAMSTVVATATIRCTHVDRTSAGACVSRWSLHASGGDIARWRLKAGHSVLRPHDLHLDGVHAQAGVMDDALQRRDRRLDTVDVLLDLAVRDEGLVRNVADPVVVVGHALLERGLHRLLGLIHDALLVRRVRHGGHGCLHLDQLVRLRLQDALDGLNPVRHLCIKR